MNLKKGFTLIELLVVIAIISILAAIIFPVFARAKDGAYFNSDMSNMGQIGTALQLYKADQGAYPPALLGYATGYLSGGVPGDPNPTESNVVPANAVQGALFPKRVNSLATLTPAYDKPNFTAVNSLFSIASWPPGVGIGANPRNQRFGPADPPATRAFMTGDPSNPCMTVNRYYYNISGYDNGTVPDGVGGFKQELRYTLFWTGYTVPQDPCNPQPGETGSALDNPRQLGYSEPPDTTVVTWDSFFREVDPTTGQPLYEQKRDIVLFLGGGAKPYDSSFVMAKAWQVTP